MQTPKTTVFILERPQRGPVILGNIATAPLAPFSRPRNAILLKQCRGCIGIVQKKMETTITGYIEGII